MHSAEICVMPEGGQTQIERPDTENGWELRDEAFKFTVVWILAWLMRDEREIENYLDIQA